MVKLRSNHISVAWANMKEMVSFKTSARRYWHPAFVAITVVFVLLAIADFVTTLMVGKAFLVLESNPLFLLIGHPWLALFAIFLANLFVLFCFLLLWASEVPFYRYMTIVMMLITIFMRCVAIKNAILVIKSGVTFEQVNGMITKQELLHSYIGSFYIPALAVVAIAIVAFIIYDKVYNQKVFSVR